MNLPRFTAELALGRTTQVYRDNGPLPTIEGMEVSGQSAATPYIPPRYDIDISGPILTVSNGVLVVDCSADCALSCSNMTNPRMYALCYQGCYNAYCAPSVGPTGVACNEAQLKACQEKNAGFPFGLVNCHFLYGPCGQGRACCGSGSDRSCVSLNDPQNCGGCGSQCAPGSSCCGGACCGGPGTNTGCCDFTGVSATSSGTPTCVELLEDGQPSGELNNPYNCGTCGNTCGAGQGCCGGKCVDLQTNSANCGTCGNVCANRCCSGGNCADFSSDPNNCGACGNVCGTGSCCNNGSCTTVPSLSSVSPNPSGNCNSSGNTNYFLAGSNCENLSDLDIWLDVSPSQNLFSPNGFSLQLNAVPPANANQINWMQYTFEIGGNGVDADVEYWTSQGGSECIIFSNQNVQGCCSNANCCSCSWWDELWGISCCSTQMASLASSNTIPAGYRLELALSTDQNSGNVTQANFLIQDNNGNQTASYTVAIPQNAQAPVQSFQVVAVGINGCATAKFSKGGGVINYSVPVLSNQQLCVQGASISCSGNNSFGGLTGESSNATYGLMNSCCGSELSQTLTT